MGSITPLGERARGSSYGRTAAWFVGSAIVGGIFAGLVAAVVGSATHLAEMTPIAKGIVLGAGCVLGAVIDGELVPLRLPSTNRQVDERWLYERRSWAYGSGYGLQLGLGVVTVVNSSSVYLWLLAAALTGSMFMGAFIGAMFGLTRGLILPLSFRAKTPTALLSLGRRVESLGSASRSATAALLGVYGGLVAIAVWTGTGGK